VQQQSQTTLFIPAGTQIGLGCGPCADAPNQQVNFCDPARISLPCCTDRDDNGLRGLKPVNLGGRRLLQVTDLREASFVLPLAAGERKEITLEVQLDTTRPEDKSLLFSVVQADEEGRVAGGVDLLVST